MNFSLRYRTRGRATTLLGGIICLVVGGIFLTIGIFMLNNTTNFLKTASASGQGVITHCEYSRSSHSSKSSTSTCTPTVRFVTESGQTIEFVSSVSSSGYQPGQEVPVMYDPDHPQGAQISSFFNLWGFPLIFLGVGGLLLLIGLVLGLRTILKLFLLIYLLTRGRRQQYRY